MTGREPPESVPKYLAEGIPKQGDATLRDIQSWIDAILDDRSGGLDEEEIAGEGESVERVEQTEKGTVVKKKVPCGKENCKCASDSPGDLHGPYKYLYYRDGDKVKSDYLGKV